MIPETSASHCNFISHTASRVGNFLSWLVTPISYLRTYTGDLFVRYTPNTSIFSRLASHIYPERIKGLEVHYDDFKLAANIMKPTASHQELRFFHEIMIPATERMTSLGAARLLQFECYLGLFCDISETKGSLPIHPEKHAHATSCNFLTMFRPIATGSIGFRDTSEERCCLLSPQSFINALNLLLEDQCINHIQCNLILESLLGEFDHFIRERYPLMMERNRDPELYGSFVPKRLIVTIQHPSYKSGIF